MWHIIYIYYPYNISIHAVLHLDVECCQFHELESFESAQQMLGKTWAVSPHDDLAIYTGQMAKVAKDQR